MNLRTLLPDSIVARLQTVEPIHAGRHNTCLLQLTNGEKLFAKLDAEPEEASYLTRLNQLETFAPFVPDLVSYTPDNGLLLTEFIHSHDGDLNQSKERLSQAMAECLVKLHQAKLKPNTHWHVSEMTVQALEVAKTLDGGLVEQMQQAGNLIESHPAYITGLHGDLVCENVLCSDQQMYLIDWEYTWWGDCRWDLVSFAVEFDLSYQEFESFVKRYQMSRSIEDSNFLQVAWAWRLVYLLICWDWAVKNNQPSERYQAQLTQFELDAT